MAPCLLQTVYTADACHLIYLDVMCLLLICSAANTRHLASQGDEVISHNED